MTYLGSLGNPWCLSGLQLEFEKMLKDVYVPKIVVQTCQVES